MATGPVYSLTERLRRARELATLIVDCVGGLTLAQEFEESQLKVPEGIAMTAHNANIVNLLTAVNNKLTVSFNNLLDELVLNGLLWPFELSPKTLIGCNSFAVDADDGASGATITADAGTPFSTSLIGVSDTIRISGCSEAVNNGDYVVGARTSSVITLTAVITGGVDVAADENMVVALIAKG